MKPAKYPIIITIDADMDNDPKQITTLTERLDRYDLVAVSRTDLPRISEKIASLILRTKLGTANVFSNFRALESGVFDIGFRTKEKEIFGGEFLLIAKKRGFKVGELFYHPSPRRRDPRITGKLGDNLEYPLLSSDYYTDGLPMHTSF